MATQIFETDRAVILPRQADTCEAAEHAEQEQNGNAFRGFFFAMLFNAFLLMTGAAAWELWRLVR
ncbi:MAG: hypothetical protein WA634_08465 [Silvibacterium sp.]